MRIFIAVRHSKDGAHFYGDLWSSNFYPALWGLGHELVESQIDLAPTSRFMDVAGDFTSEELAARSRTTDKILTEVEAAHARAPIDLFLSYFYNAHFDPAGFDRLRDLGIPTINFYCNSIYQFPNVAAIAAKVGVSWHAERDARDAYLKAGANPIWVQMAADPEMYHPVNVAERRSSACFVGQRYADRVRFAAALIKAGVPVEIYGAGWKPAAAGAGNPDEAREAVYLGRPQHQPGSAGGYAKVVRDIIANDGLVAGGRRILARVGERRAQRDHQALVAPFAHGPVPIRRVLEVFSQTEVCLNFSNVWVDGQPGSELIPHVRLRDFEAPMCRTCYLTGFTDEITEFYEVGKEIDTYRTADELVEKTRFYIAHPDQAERMRAAGFARARRDHTWLRRFEELFRKTGLGTS